MKTIFRILFILILITGGFSSAQIISTGEDSVKILLRKENCGSINLSSTGWGIGYRQGKHLTGYKKMMWEVELQNIKHPKEIKSLYPIDENSKSYIYGKLNSFFSIRTGMGIQKVLNGKPYWGGVEVRQFYYGGVSLGLAKPVYLYIWNYKPSNEDIIITTERYNPSKHDIDNIYGRAPFTNGIDKTTFYPGLYFRTGFNFEYGEFPENLKYLEVGLIADIFYKPIPIMAFNDKNRYFLSIYLSYNFGKRKN